MSSGSKLHSRILVGPEHEELEHVEIAELGPEIALALSAGGSGFSAGRMHKFDANEDGVLALRGDNAVLLAVADAHHGASAATDCLRALESSTTAIPQSVRALRDHVASVVAAAMHVHSAFDAKPSACSLLVVVLVGARVFGVSIGDCSAVVLRTMPRDGESVPRATRLAPKRETWIFAASSADEICASAELFDCALEDVDVVLLFTDGVDECCYGRPDRSIQLADIAALFAETSRETQIRERVALLAALALDGIRGQPGGQDNIAIVACDARDWTTLLA